jgi:subtilisin family serine protease
LLHLLAPGRWISSSVPGNTYQNYSGTSMAAPHVAGAFAILRQRKPSATIDEILGALIRTGQPTLDTRNNISKPRIKIADALIAISANNPFDFQAKITASDGAAADNFGYSVSISGNTAIVGVYGDDNLKGSAYIYVRNGNVWTEQQKLTASDGASGDVFGESVSISGDTAIVGARLDDIDANGNQGSAYIFVRSGTVWTQQQKLTASDGAAGNEFGRSVSISGDTAVVGEPENDLGSANQNQGSAFRLR